MSRSPILWSPTHPEDVRTPDTTRRVDDEAEIQQLLDVLEDTDCRRIVQATGDTARSAHEIAEQCGLPLSTTYRKLDQLTSTGLLADRTRIRRSGKHASEYARAVDAVVVRLAPAGDLRLEVATSPAFDDRSADPTPEP